MIDDNANKSPYRFLGGVLAEKWSAAQWVKLGNIDPLFVNDAEKILYKFIDDYVRQNGVVPPAEFTEEELDFKLPVHGAANYQLEILRNRFIEYTLRNAGLAAASALEEQDFGKAVDAIQSAVVTTQIDLNPNSLINLKASLSSIWERYQEDLKKGASSGGLKFGWETFDENSSGLEGGDLVSFVGRPSTGKTWFMLWTATRGWMQGRRPLFVTLEMPAQQISERALAMMAGVDPSPLKTKTAMLRPHKTKVKEKLAEIEKDLNDQFHVVDAKMSSTVSDVEMYARAMQSDAIYIDGAYLLRHTDPRIDADRYRRVAENIDALKAMAMRLDVPVIASWQFNRDAAKKAKKKDSEDPDLEDIGYSDAIGQHSSIVLALLQEESVATTTKRKISILKGRGGETGTITVNWDFVHCNFGEIENATTTDTLHLDGDPTN
jgi:replicative DNA helicase